MANIINPTVATIDEIADGLRMEREAIWNRGPAYYKYARPLTEDEQKVRKEGYPYVCTIELAPRTIVDGELPNNLGNHRHHSPNTHLILEGGLNIGKTGSGHPKAPWLFNGGHKRGRGKNVVMDAGSWYRGLAGNHGCKFVEGHELLSPTSATRFESRGVITQTTRDDPDGVPVTEWADVIVKIGDREVEKSIRLN